MMDIEKLIEQLRKSADFEDYPIVASFAAIIEKKYLRDAATALSTLRAESEKLRAELEQVKSEKAVALEHQGHNATWYDIGASGAHCSRCHYRSRSRAAIARTAGQKWNGGRNLEKKLLQLRQYHHEERGNRLHAGTESPAGH